VTCKFLPPGPTRRLSLQSWPSLSSTFKTWRCITHFFSINLIEFGLICANC
jgi:hypothetical protein